jgi:hypothetical protein
MKNQLSMFVIIIMHHHLINHIGGVMVNVLASIAVDSGFKPLSGQTKDYQIGIFDSPLRRRCKDWWSRNRD